MSRIPDYVKMRKILADRYKKMDNDVIIEEFIEIFGQHHVPKTLSKETMEAIERHDFRIKYKGDE